MRANSADVGGPNSADFGQIWPGIAKVNPKSSHGRCCACFGATSGRVGRNPGQLRANSGQIWAKSGCSQVVLNLAGFGPNVNLTRVRPNSTEIDLQCPNFGPNLARTEPQPANIGIDQIWPGFGLAWPEIRQTRPGRGSTKFGSTKIGPLPRFTKIGAMHKLGAINIGFRAKLGAGSAISRPNRGTQPFGNAGIARAMLVNERCSGTRAARILEMQADFSPESGQLRSKPESGLNLARVGPNSTRCRLRSTKFGEIQAAIDRIWAELGQNSPDCGQSSPRV